MYYLSHPSVLAHLTQPDDSVYQQPPEETVYRLRLSGCAWVLFYQCLILTLPTLKLLHLTKVSNWSWLWVTVPMWGPSVLLALILVLERLTEPRKLKNTK